MKNLLIAMWYQQRFLTFIVYFLQYYQISYSIGLAIDNQLIVVANDCYTRIAIGSKLSDMDIFFNIAVASISECEDECSKKRNSCNSFAFGIGIKGNGTCALSTKLPKAEEIQAHADYDIYVRSQRSPHCEPDRLYKMGSDIGQERRNETRPVTRFGSGFLNPTMPSTLSSPRTVGSVMSNGNNNPSYLQEYMSSFDDERRISDILRNRNPTPPASNPFGTNNGKVDNYNDAKPSIYSNRKSIFGQKIHSDPHFDRPGFGEPFFRDSFTGITRFNFAPHFNNNFQTYKGFVANHGPFEVFSRPISVHDGTLKTNKPAIDFSFWNDHYPTKYQNTFTNHLNQYRGQEFLNNVHKNQGIITKPKQNELITGSYDTGKTFRPIIGNTYSFETNGIKNSNGGFKDNSEIWNPGLLTAFRGFGAKITEKSKSNPFIKPRSSMNSRLTNANGIDTDFKRMDFIRSNSLHPLTSGSSHSYCITFAHFSNFEFSN